MQVSKKIKPAWKALSVQSYGFWQSALMALVLAIAASFGIFTPIDGRIYDLFVRNSPNLTAVERTIVLVDTPVSAFVSPAVNWDVIAADLIAMGAKQVAFAVIPEGSIEVVERLKKNPKVVLGADIMPDPERKNAQRFSLPTGPFVSMPHAVSDVPDPLLGVHRYQRYSYLVADKAMPSLEALTARRLGIDVPEEGRFLVNFLKADNHFPRLKFRQLQEGSLIKEIVQNRVVLLGIGNERFHRTVVTPITEGSREVTRLEFHGFALDSLLRGGQISSLHPLVKGMVLIAVWLICFLLLQAMHFQKAMFATSLMVVGLIAFAWLMLWARHIHFPIFGSMLGIGTTLVSIFQSKANAQNQALYRLATETGLASSGRLSGQMIPMDGAFWSHVLAMVDQILPLTRAILLERPDQAKRLREVHSLRCSMDAISEKRRDFTRAPYSIAIDHNDVIEVHAYLDRINDDEIQFLAPLVWDGQVLGFWAFGIEKKHMADRETLMLAVGALNKRLTELMYERRQAIVNESYNLDWHDNLIDRRDTTIQSMALHLQRIDRHITILEDLFNALESPAVVYDLFGRLLISNTRMKTMLKLTDVDVDADGRSAADLLQMVCGFSSEDARNVLIRAVFDNINFEKVMHVGKAHYLLHVSALRDSATHLSTSKDVLLNIHGVMIQFFPFSEEQVHQRRAENVFSPLAPALRGLAQILDHPNEEEVNVRQLLESVIVRIAAMPQYELLDFSIESAGKRTMAFGNYQDLERIFSSLLRHLADDSRVPGNIKVNVAVRGKELVIDMRNVGFGMPNEILQAMLDGPTLPKSEALRQIRQLRSNAFGSQGRLTLSSELGKGYIANIALQLASA